MSSRIHGVGISETGWWQALGGPPGRFSRASLPSVNYFCASRCLSDSATPSVSLPHKNATQRMDAGGHSWEDGSAWPHAESSWTR